MRSFCENRNGFNDYDENKQLIINKENFEPYFLGVRLRNNIFIPKQYNKMEIITKEGKKIVPSDICYFEVTMQGRNIFKIYLCENENDIEESQKCVKIEVGYQMGVSINNKFVCHITYKYSDYITIGIGYKPKTGEVIFTINGSKIFCLPFIDNKNGKLNETDLIAIVSLQKINEIKINVGKSPFAYDLLQECSENTEITNNENNDCDDDTSSSDSNDESNQLYDFNNMSIEDLLKRLNDILNNHKN